MQLKVKRYNGTKGLIGKSTSYCIDVMLHPSAAEEELLNRFGKWGESVWLMSDHRMTEDTDQGMHKQLLATNFGQLRQGKRLEFGTAGQSFTAEAVIREACKNVLGNVRSLATFDGTERVWEVTADDVTYVAAG